MGGAPKIGETVERVNGNDLSYADFVSRYLKKNRPVVLTGLMNNWRSCNEWVTDNGRPNLPFISTRFGKSIVQVADCCEREFTDQKRVEMSVSEFIDRWIENSETSDDDKRSLMYLKDWHFVKEHPEYVAYKTPLFFTDDWLNLYLDNYSMHGNPNNLRDANEVNCSDYRFVYMGGKGTWTPLHADVFRSYSWSANVCGKKQWYFLPPSQSHLLSDRYLKSSVYDIFGDAPENKYPGFKETIWWECTQDKNEIIFVPSGWFHQVHNLEDTISINHNWFNGYNLHWVWNLLMRDYNEAKEYIEDVREISEDFEGLCQRNLAANTGMNYFEFFIFITRFCFSNLIQLLHHKKHKEELLPYASVKQQHLVDNMIFIYHVAMQMKSVDLFSVENLHNFSAKNAASLLFHDISEESHFFELQLAVYKTYTVLARSQDVNFDARKTPLCQKFCLQSKEFITGVGSTNLENEVQFDRFGPEELIRLIEHVAADVKDLYGSSNYYANPESLGFESSIVL